VNFQEWKSITLMTFDRVQMARRVLNDGATCMQLDRDVHTDAILQLFQVQHSPLFARRSASRGVSVVS
jgi:hypothetical protein